jgi:hypothetical protein
MAEITFEGDFTDEQIAQATEALRKSLSMEGGGGAESTLQTTIGGGPEKFLTPKQRKLLKQWEMGNDCENPPDWSEYLGKAGEIKTTSKGTYRKNQNDRWERMNTQATPTQVGDFQFPDRMGLYGRAVYMPVAELPGDGIKMRALLNVSAGSWITDDDFQSIAADHASDTDAILDSHGVGAIAVEADGRVTELVVRHKSDIQILGIIPGSGTPPLGQIQYRIVGVDRQPDRTLIDVELADDSKILEKSATSKPHVTLQSNSYLHGTKLVRTSAPKLDRALVKAAIGRCKLDGVDFTDIQVHCIAGVPDFLSKMTGGFCLPSDGVINLCPHDPQAAIAYLSNQLCDRMRVVVSAGIISGIDAIGILESALKLNPEWWLEMLIKRLVGAIVLERKLGIIANGTLPLPVRDNLMMRGLQHWGTGRRRVLEALAEDYRVAHDPAGLPNLITLEWDILLPNIARAGELYAQGPASE